MTSVLGHFAAAALLFACFWATGYALERVTLRRARLGGLRGTARWVLGLAAWMALVFAFAATGTLVAGAVAAAALVSGAAAVATRLRLGSAEPDAPGARRALAGFGAAAGVLCLPLLVLALGPRISWDAAVYHLSLPRRFVEAGGFEPVPMSLYAHWPLGTELLFAVALLAAGPLLAKLVHAGLGLLVLVTVFAGARRFHHPVSGWLAAPLVLANPVVLFEMSVAYVDLAYAFFFIAGVLFVHQSRDGDAAPLWLAGLCAGALVAVKVSGPLGALALAAVALPPRLAALRRGSAAPLGALTLAFGVPVLAMGLPWVVRAALATGNPVYPFAYDWFGGPDWSPRLAAAFSDWQRSIGMGREPLDYLLLPWRVVTTDGGGYDRFAGDLGDFWVVLVPLALVAGWRLPLVRVCLGAAGAYFALWSLGSQQARFLIPALPPLALAAAATLVHWTLRIPHPRWRDAALAAAGVAALALALPGLANAARRAAPVLALHRSGSEAVLRAGVHPVYRFVARELPPEAVVLLLDTNRTFHLERDWLADSVFEASQIADWLRGAETPEAVRERLAARGVTHVLRERRDWGIAWPPALGALLRDPELARMRYRSPDGRFTLWELH